MKVPMTVAPVTVPDDTTPPATVTPAAAPGPSASAPLDNLMETLHRTGHFKHLMAAIKATGLASPFNAAGPYTVFAPNDFAFSKLAKGVLTELFAPENKARLTAVLRLHLVPRRVKAAAAGDAPSALKSLQGEDLTMTAAEGLRVNKARIVESDLQAVNGVIHVIDTVLMPAG